MRAEFEGKQYNLPHIEDRVLGDFRTAMDAQFGYAPLDGATLLRLDHALELCTKAESFDALHYSQKEEVRTGLGLIVIGIKNHLGVTQRSEEDQAQIRTIMKSHFGFPDDSFPSPAGV